MLGEFNSANDAFIYMYDFVSNKGTDHENTLALYNVGFYLLNPKDNKITCNFRNWKNKYAEIEWEWYLSENRSVEQISKYAKIWNNMHGGDYIVNSNYGWQWNRNNQLEHIVRELKRNIKSRRAYLTIYDGKENNQYKNDTPCTLNIGFYEENGYLNMSVLMRSNDLWYGFCNDQYCFSKLQEIICEKIEMPVGKYFHFSCNLHLYKEKLNKKPKAEEV